MYYYKKMCEKSNNNLCQRTVLILKDRISISNISINIICQIADAYFFASKIWQNKF